MSAFEKGGQVSFDEEAAFCEHFTLHEIADSGATAARRKVPSIPLFCCCLHALCVCGCVRWLSTYL